jgi:pterin-4a-carbinolamine dehydratase
LERQVQHLEETTVDVVYGDWCVLYHTSAGDRKYSHIHAFGRGNDIIEDILTHGWLATASPLFRREIISKTDGWDENIRTVEEKDFHFAVAMAGGVFLHHPDWVSVFRRYGSVTLSTSDLKLWTNNAYILYKKMEYILQKKNLFTSRYREALAVSYYAIARKYYETDLIEYGRALAHARRVCPDFKPKQSTLYNLLQEVVGMDLAQQVARYKRWMERKIKLRENPL